MSYLHKERQMEASWSHLLTYDNASDGMSNPGNVSKLAANWKEIGKDLDFDGLDFQAMESLASALLARCQCRKWYNTLSPEEIIGFNRDAKVYVAYLIWDAKRINNNICSEKYFRLANMRHFSRCARKFGHEAINHALARYKDSLDASVVQALKEAFSQKVEELWMGENKLVSLPSDQGDYIHLSAGEEPA